MRVVYEEGEKETLEKCHAELKERKTVLFTGDAPDRVFGLKFKITNPAIAEYILGGLLFDRLYNFDIGIKVVGIDLEPINDAEDIKRKLHAAIDSILE